MGLRIDLTTEGGWDALKQMSGQRRLMGKTAYVEFVDPEDPRTAKQNSSLHKYCEKLAEALNEAGLDMRKVLKPEIDIPWTKYSVKDQLWRPIQQAMFGKASTTKPTTKEYQEIYKVLDHHMAAKHGVSVDWPCKESQMAESMGLREAS